MTKFYKCNPGQLKSTRTTRGRICNASGTGTTISKNVDMVDGCVIARDGKTRSVRRIGENDSFGSRLRW